MATNAYVVAMEPGAAQDVPVYIVCGSARDYDIYDDIDTRVVQVGSQAVLLSDLLEAITALASADGEG